MHPSRVGRLIAAAISWLTLLASQSALADEPPASDAPDASAALTVPSTQELEAFVDGIITPHLQEHRVAGAQVAVIKDGQPLLVKGYGIDSVAPQRGVDPQRSLFRLGSISKTFTWLSLMQLAERGLIDLDDPINDYLPDELDVSDEGFEQPIRIVDLMNHTAGFEDEYERLFVGPGDALLPLDQHLRKYRPHRVLEPRRYMVYSNYGAALAGAIVAHVAGTEFESYVEQNIFAPLGMHNTTLREQYARQEGLPEPMKAEIAHNKALGLEWRNGKWTPYPQEHITSMAPAGSAVSTAADMARYMAALMNPEQLERAGVLKQETYARLRQPSFQGAPGLPAIHHGFFNSPLGVSRRLQLDNLSHTGGTLHFGSVMVVIPDLSPRLEMGVPSAATAQGALGIFVAVNSRSGTRFAFELPEQILTRYFAGSIPPAATATDSAESIPDKVARMQEYAGAYRSMRRSYTKLEKIQGMTQVTPIEVTERGGLFASLRRSPRDEYVEIGKDLFRSRNGDATIAFARDESGAITHLIMSGGTLERIGFFQSPLWMLIVLVAGLVTSIAVVVAALWRRRKLKRASVEFAPAESPLERRSARAMVGAAVAWLAATAALTVWIVPLITADSTDAFVFSYPQLSLKIALAVVLLAAGLTVLAVVSIVPVWRERNWSVGRRVRHSIAAIVLAALVVTLMQWNVVGFKYF